MRQTIADALTADTQPFVDDVSDERRKAEAAGFPPRSNDARRASRRWRVLLSALIVDPKTGVVVPCRAENVSEGGARIKLTEPQALPVTFWLIAITAGQAYPARMIWREEDRLGVEVGAPVILDEAESATERRLHKIWVARR